MATWVPLRNTVTRSASAFDLAPPVGGEDDAAALVAQPSHVPGEPLDLPVRQRGGRLVEDDHPRLGGQHPDEFDDLPLATDSSAAVARGSMSSTP